MSIKSIGKYVDLERLGRGGMAEVYLGRDPNLDRRVAIKVILPHLAEEENFGERFCQEAKVVAALRHPNIVQIYEFDFHDNQPFMVMEYFQGGTLKDILAQHREHGDSMPLGKIANLLEPVAHALDYAHARGTVHRDIKPSNILFSSDGNPVIVDFGIAKILDQSLHLTVTGGIVGSPPYMSPEQAASKPVEKYSDIYSLGVVVYEMVAGRVPFMGDSITGVLMQHLNDPPPPVREFNPNIPLHLQDVITKVLAKAPSDRFQTADHFSEAFKKALEGEAPIQLPSLEVETVLDQPQETEEIPLTTPERVAITPEPDLPKATGEVEVLAPEPSQTKSTRRRRWPLALGFIAVVLLVAGIIAVINSGGIMPALENLGLPIGSGDEAGEVLLFSSLDNEEAITSPEIGIGGFYSLHPEDFVAAKQGNGILFNRQGNCDSVDFQEVSFPAWQEDNMNVNLEDGELTFWYQPLYNANQPEGFYSLVAITLDGDTHSSIYLDFNEGYFGLNLVDNEWNWLGTSANYRAPLWQSGDWVHIRAVWDSWIDDSLQLYVNDLRVDSGGVPGGWSMDAEEYAVRIFVGSSTPCGESTANGIIDEIVIRHFP